MECFPYYKHQFDVRNNAEPARFADAPIHDPGTESTTGRRDDEMLEQRRVPSARHHRMRRLASFALLMGLTISPAIASQNNLHIECGGFTLPYSATIGAIRPSHGARQPSSVEAIAAITAQTSTKALAWYILDERGQPWLAVERATPPDLKELWTFKKADLDFDVQPNMKIRFAPLAKTLPSEYRLTACPETS